MPQNILQRSYLSLPDYPGVQHLISQQAAATPGTLAVVCGKQYLTYAQLEWQANQLAHALLRREIGPGVCVGLCLSRSVDLLVALLAVLKAGGCFLLLETTSPLSQIFARLDECVVPLLVTQQRISRCLAAYRGDVLCLDRDQFLWVGESSSAPSVSSGDELPASILYTSNREYTLINQHNLLTTCLCELEDLPSEPGRRSVFSSTQPIHLPLLLSSLLTGGCIQFLLAEELERKADLA